LFKAAQQPQYKHLVEEALSYSKKQPGTPEAQTMAFMDKLDDGGTQSYHGLILTLDRRAVNGVTVGVNYTLSHCYGDQTDATGDGPNPGQGYTNPLSRDADRGKKLCHGSSPLSRLTCPMPPPSVSRRH
jgi:hypothetical protein